MKATHHEVILILRLGPPCLEDSSGYNRILGLEKVEGEYYNIM
jgi:hypothetical protein